MSSLEQMTINIVNYLEKKLAVCQVKNDIKPPAERPTIAIWEQRYSLLLPGDLKSFYQSTNGFHLTWSVKMENATVPVGTMHVNSVGQLSRLENAISEGSHIQPSLWDLDLEEEKSGRKVPSFTDSRIFELDPCDGYGKVCLVYSGAPKDYSTKIWFLDRSMQWHFIADSFMAYYRLMLVHLGLPHWQFAFSEIGLPPHSKQWYNLYAPVRLAVVTEGQVDIATHSEMEGRSAASPLDASRIFKGKSKATGTQNTANLSGGSGVKKRKPTSSARPSSAMSKQGGQSSSQATIKTAR